jgi:hypothetical protein
MSVFIQNSITGKYAGPRGGWTKDLEKAVAFKEVLRAWEMISEKGLSGIQIVVHSSDSRPDLTLPIRAG